MSEGEADSFKPESGLHRKDKSARAILFSLPSGSSGIEDLAVCRLVLHLDRPDASSGTASLAAEMVGIAYAIFANPLGNRRPQDRSKENDPLRPWEF